ncbi:MAG: N-acetyltransferase domain-containing protein [Candidatus Kapaibacterium sp.]|nr:MAG: N-acetyltransferase domain-containing protein [Candidatus Kapabacteria bacterium]
MNIEIKEISTKKEKIRFIKSQFQFYQDDPNFVPPIISDRYKMIDTEKHPFYKHAELKLFMAFDSKGDVLGRIAGIINHNHNKTHNDKAGFFGFFECVNNLDVAKKLFEQVENWLFNKGYDTVVGPANPSMNDEVGLLIDGFDSPPVIMMTYNPRYYIDLVEGAGYSKAKDLYAYLLEPHTFTSDKMLRLQEVVRRRYDVTIREVDFSNKKNFWRDVEIFKEVYNSAWVPNWGFVRWTDEEFYFLAKDLKLIAEPKLALIAESKGKVAGFGLALPNIYECLIYNKSGSTLGALYHILTKKKRIQFVRIIALGIKPEFQRTGIDSVLYYELGTRGIQLGYRYGEASWIFEDNEMMNKGLTSTMNARVYKTYRIYQKKLS